MKPISTADISDRPRRGRPPTGQPSAAVRSIGRVSDADWAAITAAITASGQSRTQWIVTALLARIGDRRSEI